MLANSIGPRTCLSTGSYSKETNAYFGKLFDSSKPSNYIVQLDASNFYWKALSYPMPQSGFTWLSVEQWPNLDWLAQRAPQSTGSFMQCDRDYAAELHD